jgi:hypothetical protein
VTKPAHYRRAPGVHGSDDFGVVDATDAGRDHDLDDDTGSIADVLSLIARAA